MEKLRVQEFHSPIPFTPVVTWWLFWGGAAAAAAAVVGVDHPPSPPPAPNRKTAAAFSKNLYLWVGLEPSSLAGAALVAAEDGRAAAPVAASISDVDVDDEDARVQRHVYHQNSLMLYSYRWVSAVADKSLTSHSLVVVAAAGEVAEDCLSASSGRAEAGSQTLGARSQGD